MGLALLDAPATDSVPECAVEGASRITVRPEYVDEEPEPRREKKVSAHACMLLCVCAPSITIKGLVLKSWKRAGSHAFESPRSISASGASGKRYLKAAAASAAFSACTGVKSGSTVRSGRLKSAPTG